MGIKAVVFDLDDTLISEKQYVLSGFRKVSRAVSEKFGLDRSIVYDTLNQLFSVDSKLVFNRMFDKFGMPYHENDVRWLVDIYRNHDPQIDFFDDVIPCLQYLKQNGLKTGIITDGYKNVQRKKIKSLLQ
jgi:putative hydrolase of the HAD superfamily